MAMSVATQWDPDMTSEQSRERRHEYLNMTGRLGVAWLDVFAGNTEFYSAAFWDLMTGIWKAGGTVRKTDALGFMTAVKSPHTAGKYVDTAIHHGILVESDNPADARSKLLALSPDMQTRLDTFLDSAIAEVTATGRGFEGGK